MLPPIYAVGPQGALGAIRRANGADVHREVQNSVIIVSEHFRGGKLVSKLLDPADVSRVLRVQVAREPSKPPRDVAINDDRALTPMQGEPRGRRVQSYSRDLAQLFQRFGRRATPLGGRRG